MKAIRRVWPWLVWAALLLPFFLGAEAAHPATDDFTFALYTHPTWVQTGSVLHVLKDALSYALRTWRDWQGTITGVIIMTLNPAVFSLEHYGVHAVLLLAGHLVSWLVFLRHMLNRRLGLDKKTVTGLALALSAMSLLFLPDIVEGIYWFNGAWFYTGAQAAALLILVLCDRFSEYRGSKGKMALLAVLCAGLLFALGMDNYITAMMTAAALLMLALARAWAWHGAPLAGCTAVIGKTRNGYEVHGETAFGPEAKRVQRDAAIRTALLLLPIGLGLLISVIAPGNSVRMERDGAHQSGMGWLMLSIVWTLRDAAGYIVRFTTRTPLLALMVAVTPLLSRAVQPNAAKARCCPPIWATVLGFYLILCAMIIPHMYSSGYAGSGRVVNMYHFYVLVALPIVWVMTLLRMKGAARQRLAGAGKLCTVLGAALLALCLAQGQLGGYVKLIGDQLDGTQDKYITQFKNEYALCEAAGESDEVILPAWTVQTMTGKPTAYENAAMWTNEAMADYFGVKRVRVGE